MLTPCKMYAASWKASRGQHDPGRSTNQFFAKGRHCAKAMTTPTMVMDSCNTIVEYKMIKNFVASLRRISKATIEVLTKKRPSIFNGCAIVLSFSAITESEGFR